MRPQATILATLVLCLLFVGSREGTAVAGAEEPAAEGAGDDPWLGVDAIDARSRWKIKDLEVEGVGFLQRFLYLPKLQTATRSWWVFWRDRPDFSPADLEADVKNVQRSLHAEGFYNATARAEVEILEKPGAAPENGDPEDADPGEAEAAEPGLVNARIVVDLGERVLTCTMTIDLGDLGAPEQSIRRLRRDLVLKVGEAFTEVDYQGAAQQIVDYLGERGYAVAQAKREARIDVARRCADVEYTAQPGRIAVFGETEVDGLESVSPVIATRELAYEEGELYDARKTAETVRRLRGLRLFTIVRLEPEGITPEGEAPMRLTVTEGPPREVRFGIGYSTEEGVRGLASWDHYNWLGGGRQLGFSARISEIRRSIAANFLQPYFPARSMNTLLSFTLGQDDESTYTDNFVRIVPRIDWTIDDETTANFFFTGGYDSLSGVSDASKDALPGFENSGFTTAPGAGVRWARFDDKVNPTKGVSLAFSAEVAGTAFGGDFDWYRLVADSRGYYPVYGEFVLGTRLTAGTIVPFGDTDQIQFWDRFYAGGTGVNPVRGYGRRRVGPLSDSDDPIGGRSVVVGSLELRHPLFGPLQGVVFVDAGDVELSAWQFDPANIQTGVGFGVRALSPVGPVELDLGFGLDRRGGDSLVEVHFTIGPNF